jgi:uncharacterized integral membrane protein
MRLLTWIILLALVFAAMVFAVSNADQVTLRLWPFPSSWNAPLYAVVAGAVAAGLIVGVLYGWLMGGAARRRARALRRENKALAAELDDLRAERTRVLRGSGPEDMD